jgi:hypothetical protein
VTYTAAVFRRYLVINHAVSPPEGDVPVTGGGEVLVTALLLFVDNRRLTDYYRPTDTD